MCGQRAMPHATLNRGHVHPALVAACRELSTLNPWGAACRLCRRPVSQAATERWMKEWSAVQVARQASRYPGTRCAIAASAVLRLLGGKQAGHMCAGINTSGSWSARCAWPDTRAVAAV